MSKKTLLLILVFLFNAMTVFCQQVIVIDAVTMAIPLEAAMEITPDLSLNPGIDNLQQVDKLRFTPYLNHRFSDKRQVYWMRCKVRNATALPQKVFIGTSKFDSLTFYGPGSNGQVNLQYGGNLYPNHQKKLLVGGYSFAEFQLPAGQTVDLYFKGEFVNGEYYQFSPLPFTLYSEKGFTEKYIAPRKYDWFFLGAVLIMAVYNLLLWITTRETGYLFYVFYNLSLLAFTNLVLGHLIEIFFFSAAYQEHAWMLLGLLSVMAYVLLARNFLSTKDHPKVHFFLGRLLIMQVIAIVFTLFGVLSIAIPLCYLIAFCVFAAILGTAIIKIRTGYSPAVYFLVGNAGYILGSTIFILQLLTLLPEDLLFGLRPIAAVQIGIMLELALFSIGLGSRINIVKKQLTLEQLQKSRLQTEREIERNELINQKNRELESKVKERTRELEDRNEEINQQNLQIESVNRALSRRNHEVTQSINYARRIQQAMLPNSTRFKQTLPESFIFFKPRDIVSGDFYWFSEVEDKIILVAADCTGHGVPGALMSMIGNDLLHEIVTNRNVTAPEEILTILNKGVSRVLKQEETENRDGMDMAICVIDKNNKTITFAGAKNPLVYIQNNELVEIKGDKFPIGGFVKEKNHRFTAHTISIQETVCFYLFSDGYEDQFGGADDKKFMKRRFKEMLLNQHSKSMAEQYEHIADVFEQWKGAQEQTDDVLVIGIRLS